MVENKTKLKIGYTTGTHATAMLKSALIKYVNDIEVYKCPVTLPSGDSVDIEIEDITVNDDVIKTTTVKTNNDDLDVTKRCKLICLLSVQKGKIDAQISTVKHQPHLLEANDIKVFMYAGKGVGVVTKRGLKVESGYPAINPVPLNMMETAIQEISNNIVQKKQLHCVIQIENGLEIAKDTANQKVGILGGLSILGTKGIVKPVSARAYLDSIEAELAVARETGSKELIFTIGNTSLSYAKTNFSIQEECFIDIGNYIFDSLRLLKNTSFSDLYYIANIGKMTKVAQGFKNTHNKFGWIDFEKVTGWLLDQKLELKDVIENMSFSTMKELELTLLDHNDKGNYNDLLHKIVTEKAVHQITDWILSLEKENNHLLKRVHTIITDGKKQTNHAIAFLDKDI